MKKNLLLSLFGSLSMLASGQYYQTYHDIHELYRKPLTDYDVMRERNPWIYYYLHNDTASRPEDKWQAYYTMYTSFDSKGRMSDYGAHIFDSNRWEAQRTYWYQYTESGAEVSEVKLKLKDDFGSSTFVYKHTYANGKVMETKVYNPLKADSTQLSLNNTTWYRYDMNGRRIHDSTIFGTGFVSEDLYKYDGNGKLTEHLARNKWMGSYDTTEKWIMSWSNDGLMLSRDQYAYDMASKQYRLLLANQYEYDAQKRLVRNTFQEHDLVMGITGYEVVYAYNGRGNILRLRASYDDGSGVNLWYSMFFADNSGSYEGIIYEGKENGDSSISGKLVLSRQPLSGWKKEKNAGFSFYPNPAADQIWINGLDEDVSYEILDLKGSLIAGGMSRHQRIDVADITKGVYILKIRSGLWVRTEKLIIEK